MYILLLLIRPFMYTLSGVLHFRKKKKKKEDYVIQDYENLDISKTFLVRYTENFIIYYCLVIREDEA